MGGCASAREPSSEQRPLVELASGLEFPEGPVYLDDGSVLLVEIKAGCLTRVFADGSKTRVCQLGGGPNSAAAGPDRQVIVPQNGGFTWGQAGAFTVPTGTAADYKNGAIQSVNLDTGREALLYVKAVTAQGEKVDLRGPNDLVLDGQGGFWFSDLGKKRAREKDFGGVYYAKTDQSSCREIIYPMESPNGIALSSNGQALYVAETTTGKLIKFTVEGPGQLREKKREEAQVLYTLPDFYRFDSMAVDSEGSICVATLGQGRYGVGGIAVVAPDGGLSRFITTGDPMTTNICFGGKDMHDAFITLSGTGRLVKTRWHCPGHRCHYESSLVPAALQSDATAKAVELG